MSDITLLEAKLPFEFVKWLKIDNSGLWFNEQGKFDGPKFLLAARHEFPQLALALIQNADLKELIEEIKKEWHRDDKSGIQNTKELFEDWEAFILGSPIQVTIRDCLIRLHLTLKAK